tara:strand:- start:823 stop:2028 length:1206 start_codon:yes stop_codon:yes gene_type:complete
LFGEPIDTFTQSTEAFRDYVFYHVIPSGAAQKDCTAYGLSRLWKDSNSNRSQHDIQGIRVNRNNGLLTPSTEQNVWTNTSAAQISKNYVTYSPTSGAFFSGGKATYPGQSTAVHGFSKGVIDTLGSPSLVSTQVVDSDSGYTGLFFGDHNANGRFITGGFSVGPPQVSGYRTHSSASPPLVSSAFNNYATYYGDTNGVKIFGQPDYLPSSSTDIVSSIVIRGTNGWGCLNLTADGSIAFTNWENLNGTFSSDRAAFRHSDGSLIWIFLNSAVYRQVGTGIPDLLNSFSSPEWLGNDKHYQHIGLGNDRWLSYPLISSPNHDRRIVLWQFNSSHQFVHIASFSSPTFGGTTPFEPFDFDQTWHPVWHTTSDALPTYWLRFLWLTGRWKVQSFQPLVSLSSYY